MRSRALNGDKSPFLLGGVLAGIVKRAAGEFVQHGLRGTTSQRVGRAGIETVFEHIQVERAQIHGAEVVDLVIGAVECIGAIRLGDRAHHFLQPMQHPAVDLRHLGVGHGVCHRIEAIEVGQAVAQVLQAAVTSMTRFGISSQAHILGVFVEVARRTSAPQRSITWLADRCRATLCIAYFGA